MGGAVVLLFQQTSSAVTPTRTGTATGSQDSPVAVTGK